MYSDRLVIYIHVFWFIYEDGDYCLDMFVCPLRIICLLLAVFLLKSDNDFQVWFIWDLHTRKYLALCGPRIGKHWHHSFVRDCVIPQLHYALTSNEQIARCVTVSSTTSTDQWATSTIFNLRLLALHICVCPCAQLVGLSRLWDDVWGRVSGD